MFYEFCFDVCTLYLLLSLSPVAVVGLERTFYQVNESAGVVEVCAVVYSPISTCPIPIPFDVNLSVVSDDGGK